MWLHGNNKSSKHFTGFQFQFYNLQIIKRHKWPKTISHVRHCTKCWRCLWGELCQTLVWSCISPNIEGSATILLSSYKMCTLREKFEPRSVVSLKSRETSLQSLRCCLRNPWTGFPFRGEGNTSCSQPMIWAMDLFLQMWTFSMVFSFFGAGQVRAEGELGCSRSYFGRNIISDSLHIKSADCLMNSRADNVRRAVSGLRWRSVCVYCWSLKAQKVTDFHQVYHCELFRTCRHIR